MTDLAKLTVLVPESRELDLFAGMLEAEGAFTFRCPLVQILDLEDSSEAERWIEELIQRPFDDMIFLTGDGLRKLAILSEARHDAFIHALGKTRTITRGPKPARALREIGLTPTLPATSPTSDGVLDALASENLQGRRIGVQLYPGEGGLPLVAALTARGATVLPVTPYRYASRADSSRVTEAIHGLATGGIAMVAFTSSPQVERLAEVAGLAGLEKELADGLARALVASIGPIVTQTLKSHGVTSVIQPEASFHLKPLVRAIVTAWQEAGEKP